MPKKVKVKEQEDEVQPRKKKAKQEEDDLTPEKVTPKRIQTVGGVTGGRVTNRDWEKGAPWNRKDPTSGKSRFEKRGRTAND